MKGIDISKWQGNFSIADAVKNHGIEFVILRIGGADGGLYKDSKFDDYYKQAKAAGIPVGCYFFGNATNEAEADKEAAHWIDLMKGKQFDFPVFYDVESKAMMALKKRELTNVVKYMCDKIEKAGYWVGIYSSTSVYDNKVYDKELSGFSHWVADWRGNKPSLKSGNDTQLWQTGTEQINGDKVDFDYCYVEYFSEKIKELNMNGYGVKVAPMKSVFQLACEIWAGLWGCGEYRKNAINAAGYNYDEVQKMVNKLRKAAEQ